MRTRQLGEAAEMFLSMTYFGLYRHHSRGGPRCLARSRCRVKRPGSSAFGTAIARGA